MEKFFQANWHLNSRRVCLKKSAEDEEEINSSVSSYLGSLKGILRFPTLFQSHMAYRSCIFLNLYDSGMNE